MLTVGQCLLFGLTIAIKRKFSASNFWTDCVQYNCTVANYIGETCRYILAAHKGKNNINHGIKKMFGNGLKKDVWKDFVNTFEIPHIIEFYGSTEGNTNLINLDDTIGSVGFLPFYLAPVFSIHLIKYDEETKQPIRDENGYCIKCKKDEPGVLIGKINEKISTHSFDGYVDTKETVKKILKDVFKKGDSYFNSGDLMVRDELGYLYFKDRTGDTYRLISLGLKVFTYIMPLEWRQDTIPKLFTKTARRNPNKIAFYFEDETWTFKQVDDYCNTIANYFLSAGYKKGDTVALLLENRPEYVAIWLGLTKIGIVPALINSNLVAKSLHHCISIVNAKALIFGSDFVKAVTEIQPILGDSKLFQLNTSPSPNEVQAALNLNNIVAEVSSDFDDKYMEGQSAKDTVLYVYTSGTTGMPKAARITHSRFIFMSCAIYHLMELTRDDVFYNPLPFYHASGGIMSLGLCLILGLTMGLRKKFSASNFWKDCIKFNCTASNYIGETCRYILEANKGQTNINHKVKKMYGNGLKKDIWEEFVRTFNNPRMYEGYGSTEGNVKIINFEGKIGAIGFIPTVLDKISPVVLIKYDEETYEPVRDKNGFCVKSKVNEPGLLIGCINKKLATCRFEGYADQKDTSKKILTDVFKKGDQYFNSGDLLIKDEYNYLYFNDRVGDTYRWKGENVATTEVERIASDILGPKEIVAYGVEVPNHEGRAGVLGILDKDNSINTKVLAEGLKSHLPTYAIPVFLRKLNEMPLTTTFKIRKNQLQKEGFDINDIKDQMYVYDIKSIDYIPLQNVYQDVVTGKRKL